MASDQKNYAEGTKKLLIEVDPSMLKKTYEAVFEKMSRTVKVDGFRSGKAPKHLIEKQIGARELEEKVLEEIIPITYYHKIKDENLNVVGAPKIKVIKIALPDVLVFEAEIEILPEILLPNLSKIQVSRNKVAVKETEVTEMLANLAKRFAKYIPVDRSAKIGDRVEVDFEGFIDNLPFDGNKSQNHPIILGEGRMVPGFEEGIIGLRKDQEEKEIEICFPGDYHAKHLAGRKAKFKVKIKEITEIELPLIDNDLAKKVGGFTSLNELRDSINKEILNSKIIQERQRVEEEIINQLIKRTEINPPASLVEQEAHRMFHEAEDNLSSQGLTLDKYLTMTKKTPESLREEIKPEAVKRVKAGLLLSEVAKSIKANVTEEELIEEKDLKLASVQPEDKEKVQEFYQSEDGKQALKNIIIGRKVLQYLYELCSK